MRYLLRLETKGIQVLFLILPFLFLVTPIKSQENNNNAIGSWMVLSIENKVSEKWSIPVVSILSYENWTEQPEFGFIRTGLSYKNSPNLKFTLGLAYIDSQPLYHNEPKNLTKQYWIYEEATLKTGSRFNHRFRLENRWIDGFFSTVFNIRFRYRLEFKQQLNKAFFVKCTNEPFFNFDELHIDQNRFFLGMGNKIGKDLIVEVGYFKTHLRKNNNDRIRIALQLNTSLFRKNPEDVTLKY